MSFLVTYIVMMKFPSVFLLDPQHTGWAWQKPPTHPQCIRPWGWI